MVVFVVFVVLVVSCLVVVFVGWISMFFSKSLWGLLGVSCCINKEYIYMVIPYILYITDGPSFWKKRRTE